MECKITIEIININELYITLSKIDLELLVISKTKADIILMHYLSKRMPKNTSKVTQLHLRHSVQLLPLILSIPKVF